MNKTKHTQGPWKALPSDDDNQTRVHFGEHRDDYWVIDGGNSHFQDYANARLIAAAPEMLEMLNQIAEQMNNFSDLSDSWSKQEMIAHAMHIQSNICDLIAKAEESDS